MTAEVQSYAPAVDDLGQRVVDRIGIPRDAWEIAAQLEVLGMRDSDARTSYGVRDLFELARAIERRFRAGAYSFVVEGDDPRPRRNPALRFLGRYIAGIVFALPMALQAVSMLLWGYGIWGAVDLTLEQGSAIALGFIASYVIAGAFAQAIVRRGLFYVYQQEEALARWTALRGCAFAARGMIALLAVAALANLLFRILPWPMVAVAAAFYVALGVLWLSWALIYLVRRTVLLLVITAVALVAVLVAAKVLGAPAIVANAVGVIVADALSFATAWYFLTRMARRRGGAAVNPPRFAVIVFSTSRYFVYGLLVNAFLFADRVLAWTTPVGRDDFPPYPFWLNVRYELAMDLALAVVIVMSGVVAYAIERFSEKLIPHEKRMRATGTSDFIDEQLDAHRRRSWQLGIAAVIGAAIATALLLTLRQTTNVRLHEAMTSPVTLRVFAAAAVAYVFFMFAVRNLLLMLTLSRVQLAIRCVAAALAVDVAVGFLCSRSVGYWAAVAGLLSGAIVLSILTARGSRRVLERLDYYYYSAY